MANKFVSKFFDYLLIAVVFGVAIAIIWSIIDPIIHYEGVRSEVRVCIRVFLVLFGIHTFAVLRLYNSVVNNTRFMIKLREATLKLFGSMPAMERAMKNLNSSLGGVKAASDNLRKEMTSNTNSMEDLVDNIKRNAQRKA